MSVREEVGLRRSWRRHGMQDVVQGVDGEWELEKWDDVIIAGVSSG
jgi:hypothetical protein